MSTPVRAIPDEIPEERGAAAASPLNPTSDPAETLRGESRAERNRRNAQQSTGPRTAEGKAASSQNARTHGCSITEHRLLANEDPADFERFREELFTIYQPQTLRERLAVVEIAKCRWAIRRLDARAADLLDRELAVQCDDDLGESSDQAQREIAAGLLRVERYRRPWDKRLQQALQEFDRACLARHREERLAMARERHTGQMIAMRQRYESQQEQAVQREKARESNQALSAILNQNVFSRIFGPPRNASQMPGTAYPDPYDGQYGPEATEQSGFVSSESPTPARPQAEGGNGTGTRYAA